MTIINSKKAFTLLELIVVIFVSIILSTILFQSLTNYNRTARDAVRISDISNIQSALELYHFSFLEYPLPTDNFSVTYSGAKVWNQWYFWVDTIWDLKKLLKDPIDPLTWNHYTYSLTKNKKQYQIAWIKELYELWGNDIINMEDINNNQLLNTKRLSYWYIVWTYNEKAYKVNSWSICTVLALPSIVTSQKDDINDLKLIIDNKKLVYDWFNNLPVIMSWSTFDINWWFDFETSKEVLYSDNDKCRQLYNESNNSARKTLVENMQIAYSWSIVENNIKIQKMLELDTTNDLLLDLYSIDFVTKRLNWR